MESNFHALSRWFFCYYFCLKPCYLCSLFYYTSLFPWQQDRMRRWVATGSWEDGNAMESSTWTNNMQITLAYDKQQRKWYFFGGKTAYLVFGMCSFFWQLLFLVIFLAFLFFFFFFETKIKSLKDKKNSTWHCMWLNADAVVCASRDSSWAEHLKRLLIGKWIWLLIELPFVVRM